MVLPFPQLTGSRLLWILYEDVSLDTVNLLSLGSSHVSCFVLKTCTLTRLFLLAAFRFGNFWI
ncbi:hypothetical protein Mp_1g24040 [Marchantia polymorpha subsp. ruderalis]|uniref:Uncharacterized protein n=1 Tax=Marchantia polymorpha subsp. ruderalis TaxID=1480154 RepID=A0AAF6ATP3_MARPO|nr:hypothetical protein Mp_1g24040 [Marchantia polymorpha subsp. ruderalis]